MERRAIVLALALALPLTLYGVPYAYALVATSDHVVHSSWTVGPGIDEINVVCPSGDYAVSGGYKPSGASAGNPGGVDAFPEFFSTFPTLGGVQTSTGETPNGWKFQAGNGEISARTADVWVVCETPISVGGVSVPQFGSLYVAIALGAVVYFMLARRLAGRPTISTQS